MIRILDLDIDFFVTPIAHDISGNKRLSAKDYSVATERDVRSFLEKRCLLSRTRKLPGAIFVNHDEVFDFVRDTFSSQKVSIVHVDAHTDMDGGLFNAWHYICTDYLHRPLGERLFPQRGGMRLNAGNFLVFLVACDLITDITFVVPEAWEPDWQYGHLKDLSAESGCIALRRIAADDFEKHKFRMNINAIPFELCHETPMRVIPERQYFSEGNFDYVILTQSPGFTPAKADKILEVAKNYIQIIG